MAAILPYLEDDEALDTAAEGGEVVEERAPLGAGPGAEDYGHGWWQDNPWVDHGSASTQEWISTHPLTPTAGFRDNLMLPTAMLLHVPGERGEHTRVDSPKSKEKIAKLAASMRANGFDPDSPVSLQIHSNGKPLIYEGNHRIRAAAEAKIDKIPVEVKYLGGGEENARGSRWSAKQLALHAERPVPSSAQFGGIPEGGGFVKGYGAAGAIGRAEPWEEQRRDPLRANVEANHAALTRFVWARRLVEDHLTQARYWIEKDKKKGFVFRIDPGLPNDVVPWKLMGTNEAKKEKARGTGLAPTRDAFPLIGEGNGKMECPAWDLPAGSPSLGGACPGAVAAQTAVDPDIRRGHLSPDGMHLRVIPPGSDGPVPFREAATICSACYAGEGNFGYSEQLAANALRLAWTRNMIRTPEGLREWVEVMAEAITAIRAPVADDDYSHEAIRPFRVHSSGDFFSPKYAEAWMHLANRVAQIDPSIKFWCPTRTWAAPGAGNRSAFNWNSILSILNQPNLIVRPSAFHVGDPAPGPLAEHPAASKGSTSLVGPLDGKKPGVFHVAFPDAIAQEDDPRAEHNCPVYALKKADEKGSCGAARCRVCWTRPDVSVNYALH